MFADKNIDWEGTGRQGDEWTTLAFSDDYYWASHSSPYGLISPYNDNGADYCTSSSGTNCAYVYDSNSNLSTYVDNYVIYLKTQGLPSSATGRVLSLEEANTIKNANLQNWSGCHFWLGSAYDGGDVWCIYNGFFGSFYNFEDDVHYIGLRPVIVVPASDL